MSTSSVPRVIDALLALMAARPALQADDVLISDGWPTGDLAGKRLIAIGGQPEPTATGEQRFAALGALRRAEDYTIRLYFSAMTGGTDQKPSRDAAFGLLAEVESLTRADPTLSGAVGGGGYVEVAGGLDFNQTDEATVTTGRWALIACDLHVTNRI